jgi:ABC-type multidrug transport system ATPase subunit
LSPSIHVENIQFIYPAPPAYVAWLMGQGRRRVEALKDVSLHVSASECVSLMGSNGAGKTTLLKIILGILRPTRGTARILGLSPGDFETRRKVGLSNSDERSFYWRLTVRQNLAFFGRLWGLRGSQLEDRIDLIARDLDMEDLLSLRFGKLSTGMRQKAAIARALIHDPEVLLLDEPTRSLDPLAAATFRRLLKSHVLAGRATLIATHQIEEARELSSRCIVLSRGSMVHDGAIPGMDELEALLSTGRRP